MIHKYVKQKLMKRLSHTDFFLKLAL
jgi:hypothetical protein